MSDDGATSATIDAGSRAIERIGIPTAVCAALLAFLFWQEKGHREERAAFLASLEKVTAGCLSTNQKVDDYVRALQLAHAKADK
jgi:hypothetical protein